MKAEKFHDMTLQELTLKLNELKTELFNLRFRHATGQLSNPVSINVCKKDIARIKTILRERELGIERKPRESENRAQTKKKKVLKEVK